LGKRRVRFDRDDIEGRRNQFFGEAPGQAGDAMFFEELTLMRVSSCTVFAGRLASFAAAVAALVDDDARTDVDIVDLAAALDHFAGDFMAEDLRHLIERNGSAVCIAVKV